MQLPHVILETDCLQVYNALVDKRSSPNGFGLIIDDCRVLAMSVGEVIFSFVRRFANTAAHVVARMRGFLSDSGEWRHVPPPWLLSNLYGSAV